MRRLIQLVILMVLCQGYALADTLTGTINVPNSTGVTGTLILQLSQQTAQLATGGCGGPAVLVPTAQVIITVTAGALIGSPAVVANDCMTPSGTYYIATVRDAQNNVLFKENWQITLANCGSSSTCNVGVLPPVIVPTGTVSIGSAFVTNLIINGTCVFNGGSCSTFGAGGNIGIGTANDVACYSASSTISDCSSLSAKFTGPVSFNNNPQPQFNQGLYSRGALSIDGSGELNVIEGAGAGGSPSQETLSGLTTGHCLGASYNNSAIFCIPTIGLPFTWTGAQTFGSNSSIPISSLSNAAGNNAITLGAFQQEWVPLLTSNGTSMLITETAPSTGGSPLGQRLLSIVGSASYGSTAIPVNIENFLNGSQTLPALYVNPWWNTSGVVDAAILEQAENSASGAGSKLLDLQVVSTGPGSVFSVDKTGLVSVEQIPAFVFLDQDFTTANNTNFQAIVGSANNLAWTMPANTNGTLEVPFTCHLVYSQATGAVSDSFGIQDVSVAPTNLLASGSMETNTGVPSYGNLTLASTTATAIVTGTPNATATTYNVDLSGLVEQPSNAGTSVIQIMAKTTTGADAITVKRDSFCRLN